MNGRRYLWTAALAACAMLTAAGCKSNPPAAAPTTAQGPTANSDGSMTVPAQQPAQAPATSQAAAPQASAAPAPVAQPAPAPAPAPPQPVALTAAAGTRVVVRTTETLAASKNEVGDGFTGVLEEPIVSKGGSTIFPRGTRVSGTVVAAKGRGRFKGAGALGVEINTVGSTRVQTSEYEKAEAGKGKRTGGLIGGGAGLGAIIGGLAGGGKGAVIGGLAGAGAGTAGAAYTGNKDVVIPSESVITFRLVDPLTIRR